MRIYKFSRKIVVVALLVFYLVAGQQVFFFFPRREVSAESHAISSRVDFDSGYYSETESYVKEGEIHLKSQGTWNARVWKTPFLTLNDGTTFATDGTYTYMLIARDTQFIRYLPDEDRWQTLASAPHMVYSGADMIVLGNYIYVSFGGYQREFSRYSIVDNTWTDKANLPDLTFSGSSLQTDGTYIYTLRGAATTDFWRYDPSTNAWTTLTGPPATMSTGADLIYDNSLGTPYLYSPRGSNTTTFYRYDINAGTWSTMAVAPGTLNDNGNITKKGDYIYVLRGSNTNTFYRYRISTDTWSTLTNTPATNRYVGLTYNANDDLIYVFRGNNTYDWWKYDPDTDTYLGPADLPAAPGSGADVVYYSGEIYYKRGGNNASFYKYTIASDTWTTLTSAPAATNDDTKGIRAGSYLYYFRGGNTTTFYRYDPSGNSWATLAAAPANVSYGSSLSYPGSGNYIYATRGGLTTVFWRYNISTDTWDDAGAADMPTDSENGYGARLVSDGTDVYAVTGSGISNLLKYTVSSNSWSVLGNLPFSPYWGTDIVFYNGKIYAQSGYYKTDLWEYTISTDTWLHLKNMSGYYPYDLGPYNGGSIAADTVNGVLYSINGQNILRLLTYTVGSENYPVSGTWTSSVIDLSYVSGWTSLTNSSTTPGNSSVTVETATSSDKTTWSSWETVSGTVIASPTARYMKIRATLTSTSDHSQSPTLSTFTVNYTGDATAPTNPSVFNGFSQSVGGVSLTSGSSYTYSNPYFSWSGASDGQTSVSGYYVYFGTNAAADPAVSGNFQTASNYTVTSPFSTGTYYLRLKTKDQGGNISAATTGFTYQYNGVSPPQTITQSTSADFSGGTASHVSTSSDKIALSGTAGFWQQQRLSLIPGGVSYGASFAYVAGTGKLYTFRGNNTTTFYEYDIASDTWTSKATAPAAVYQGGDLVEGPSGYLFGFPGRNLNTFWRYDIGSDTWSDAAAADAPYALYYGSSAVYDGSRYIYVLRGNNDDAYMRYDTQSDTWDSLANTDFGSPTYQPNNNVYFGGDLAYDGDAIVYAIQGNTNTGFSAYNINSDSWSRLPNLPVLPYDGAQISYDSSSNAVYYISGWSNPFIYKYDLNDQTWIKLPDSPLPISAGAAMRNANGSLYILRGGGQTTFWKYDIASSSWFVPTTGLFGTTFRGTDYNTFNYGANITKGDGSYFYITKGNYDNLFVRYDSASGETVRMADAPAGFYIGTSFAYDSSENKLYAIPSQYVRRMFVYDIASDTWSEDTSNPPPFDVGSGSSMTYDGSRYIYWTRAGGQTTFYRYDTQGSGGSKWSSLANTPASISYGSDLVYKGGYIYAARGNNTLSFYRYDVSGNTWSDPVVADLPSGGTIYNDGFLVDSGGDLLYACRGANTNTCYSYSISTNTWTQIADAPAQIYTGGAAASNGTDKIFVIAGPGTNTYSDGLYSYIMQTSSSSVEKTGSFTTSSIDLTSNYKYAGFSVDYTSASNATFTVSTRSSSDNSIWTTWQQASEEKITGSTYSYKFGSNVNRYVQLKFDLTSTDGVYSGSINEYSIYYYQDSDIPTNPTQINGYNTSSKSAALTTGTWYNHTQPYFEWPDAETTGGASDSGSGSGIAGYYVYFGTNASADPVTDGQLVTVSHYSPSTLTSGQTYYLRILAKDDAGNTAASVWDAFTYKYDSSVPSNPSLFIVTPAGFTANNSFNISWSGATDSATLIDHYCYKTGEAGASETCSNVASASGALAYKTGTNTLFVKAYDEAGNAPTDYASTSYYYSSTAPGAPTNLVADPPVSEANNFAFSWEPPDSSTYSVPTADLRYFYKVNQVPTASNLSAESPISATYLSSSDYADLEINTLYVVAWDGTYTDSAKTIKNIDYNNYAQVTFTSSSTAPGIPRNLDISDVSIKETESWRLALSWDAPVSTGSAGIHHYNIYQSTTANASCATGFDGFQYVANTTQKSYVDTGLTQEDHYYCIKACNKANNCSASSGTVTLYPDGKWRTAPDMVASPSATVKTKSATVTWSTNRDSNSFVKYGKNSGEYGSEVGSSDQVSAHSIDLAGLDPGTTYYYKVLWTDEDGNTGSSDELSFATNAAPLISSVTFSDVSIYSANVAFTTKNAVKATIEYGETIDYGLKQTISTSKDESSYTVELSDLTEGTEYHLRITAEDDEGNTFAGDDYTFETLPVPKIENLRIQQVVGMPTATIRLIWASNSPISSIVTYYPTSQPERALDQIKLVLATTHEVIIKDLADETAYTFLVKGKDSVGNEATSITKNITTSNDVRAPELQNLNVETTIVGVGEEARAQVIVSWDTDEPSTTQVEYAQGTGTTYGQSTQEDTNLTLNHTVTIPGLTPSKIYHLRALSKDKAKNLSQSPDSVVITPKATQDALNLVINNLSKTFGFLKNVYGK